MHSAQWKLMEGVNLTTGSSLAHSVSRQKGDKSILVNLRMAASSVRMFIVAIHLLLTLAWLRPAITTLKL